MPRPGVKMPIDSALDDVTPHLGALRGDALAGARLQSLDVHLALFARHRGAEGHAKTIL